MVDSAVARGSIRAIDGSAALDAPGVIALVTHENAPRLQPFLTPAQDSRSRATGGLGEARQPLQDGTIYYGAQSIAVVVADTPERARHAATLVRVTYDTQAPELDMETATRKRFPEMFAGAEPMQKSADDARAALEAAPVRVTSEYESAIHHHNPIELLATTAVWEERDGEDHLTLYDSTRAVDLVRDFCAGALDMPTSNIRVVSHFIGGAFGSKAWNFHNPLLVALAARLAKRPVKVEWRRQQIYSVGGHRPGMRQTLSLGATRDGKLQAIIHDSRTHSSPVSGYTEFGARMTRMMYASPNIAYSNRLSFSTSHRRA